MQELRDANANAGAGARKVASTGMTPTPSHLAAITGGGGGAAPSATSAAAGVAAAAASAAAIHGGGGGGLAGMTASQAEEERRRRVDIMTALIGERWGYVSPEGVEMAAKRVGMEVMWEDHHDGGSSTTVATPTAFRGLDRRRRRRGLNIAGERFLAEVAFVGEEVESLNMDYGEARWREEWDGVARVLKGDLMAREEEGGGYRGLGDFVKNLEGLKRLDRAGKGGKVNCFEAIGGLKRGLDVLFTREMEDEKGKGGKNTVMCSKGGVPAMHEHGRVGLGVQYWKEQHFIGGKESDENAMDIDEPDAEPSGTDDKLWTAMIECESWPADSYPSARVSEQWIQEADSENSKENQMAIVGTNLVWQEPAGDVQDSMNGELKQPDVRFIARLDPSIVVPFPVALQLHESLGSPIPQETILPITFETLLFADVDGINALQATTPRVFEKTVTSYDATSDSPSSHTHKNTLFLNSQDMTNPHGLARALTDLPFRHPMQLINLFPTLRQWALISSILRRSFTKTETDTDTDHPTTSPDSLTNTNLNGTSNGAFITTTNAAPTFQSLEDELADFLSSPLPNSTSKSNSSLLTSASSSSKVKDINISFATSPIPQFQLQFQNPKYGGKLAQVQFSVGLNGTIEGVDVDDGGLVSDATAEPSSQHIGDEGKVVGRREMLREKVKRVIEVGEDLGVLVEWICGA